MTNVFNKTELAEFNAPDNSVPLVIGDTSLDTTGLYITGISGIHKPTVQIMSAADSSIWINTFGQKPSPTQLNGIIMPTPCGGGAAINSNVKKSLLSIYEKYKISKAKNPLKVTYNGMVMSGYFMDLRFANATGQIHKAMNFSIVYLCVVESALSTQELKNAAFSG